MIWWGSNQEANGTLIGKLVDSSGKLVSLPAQKIGGASGELVGTQADKALSHPAENLAVPPA